MGFLTDGFMGCDDNGYMPNKYGVDPAPREKTAEEKAEREQELMSLEQKREVQREKLAALLETGDYPSLEWKPEMGDARSQCVTAEGVYGSANGGLVANGFDNLTGEIIRINGTHLFFSEEEKGIKFKLARDLPALKVEYEVVVGRKGAGFETLAEVFVPKAELNRLAGVLTVIEEIIYG